MSDNVPTNVQQKQQHCNDVMMWTDCLATVFEFTYSNATLVAKNPCAEQGNALSTVHESPIYPFIHPSQPKVTVG